MMNITLSSINIKTNCSPRRLQPVLCLLVALVSPPRLLPMRSTWGIFIIVSIVDNWIFTLSSSISFSYFHLIKPLLKEKLRFAIRQWTLGSSFISIVLLQHYLNFHSRNYKLDTGPGWGKRATHLWAGTNREEVGWHGLSLYLYLSLHFYLYLVLILFHSCPTLVAGCKDYCKRLETSDLAVFLVESCHCSQTQLLFSW